VEKKDKKSPSS